MARNNLQKPLQPFPPVLNHLIAKAIREYLSGQRRDRDTRRLALENVAEVFEIGVPATNDRLFEFEGGDVGSTDNFVGSVH